MSTTQHIVTSRPITSKRKAPVKAKPALLARKSDQENTPKIAPVALPYEKENRYLARRCAVAQRLTTSLPKTPWHDLLKAADHSYQQGIGNDEWTANAFMRVGQGNPAPATAPIVERRKEDSPKADLIPIMQRIATAHRMAIAGLARAANYHPGTASHTVAVEQYNRQNERFRAAMAELVAVTGATSPYGV